MSKNHRELLKANTELLKNHETAHHDINNFKQKIMNLESKDKKMEKELEESKAKTVGWSKFKTTHARANDDINNLKLKIMNLESKDKKMEKELEESKTRTVGWLQFKTSQNGEIQKRDERIKSMENTAKLLRKQISDFNASGDSTTRQLTEYKTLYLHQKTDNDKLISALNATKEDKIEARNEVGRLQVLTREQKDSLKKFENLQNTLSTNSNTIHNQQKHMNDLNVIVKSNQLTMAEQKNKNDEQSKKLLKLESYVNELQVRIYYMLFTSQNMESIS